MYTLSVQPIAHIVLGQQLRPWVQNITPEQAAQTLEKIERSRSGGWYLPGGAAGKTKITDDELEHMESLRESPQGSATRQPGADGKWPNEKGEWPDGGEPMTPQGLMDELMGKKNNPAPAAPPAAPPAAAEQPLVLPSQVADDATRQQTFDYGQPVNPQQFLAKLKDGVRSFATFLNTTMIRPYNNAIQHALQAITKLSQEPTVTPQMEQKGEQLLQMLASIQADDAKDLQQVQQLGQLAAELSGSAGGSEGQDAMGQPPAQQGWLSRLNPFNRDKGQKTPSSPATATPEPTTPPTWSPRLPS